MGDSHQGRPAKRLKLAPPQASAAAPRQRPRQRPIQPAPPSVPMAPAESSHTFVNVAPSTRGQLHRPRGRPNRHNRASAPGPESPRQPPADHTAPMDTAPDALETTGFSPASTGSESSLNSTSTSSGRWYDPTQLMATTPVETAIVPQGTTHLAFGVNALQTNQNSLRELRPHQLEGLPASATDPQQLSPSPTEDEILVQPPEPRHHGFVSPFKGYLRSFKKQSGPRFPRPRDGRVNSYIKFNWPRRKPQSDRSPSVSVTRQSTDGDDDEIEVIDREPFQPSSALAASSSSSSSSHASVLLDPTGSIPQRRLVRSSSFPGGASTSPVNHDPSWNHDLVNHPSSNAPRMLPAHFGLNSKMDKMDKLLWSFYIGNWCPGRSVLGKTNLWLHDFAAMEGVKGVLYAITCLAGVYVYDYQPLEDIKQRIQQRFVSAERRLSYLLAKEKITTTQVGELITISNVLSMLDTVRVEGRRKRPYAPRWLEAFQQCEYFLEQVDEGSRFWAKSNVQLSSLRISQSIVVGRALILSQIMTPLPPSEGFEPEEQTHRFGWLLYGNAQDVYEIHGGCGFSKKLLHIVSQISYCAARLVHCPEGSIVPLTTRFLLSELLDMRQWSSDDGSKPWEVAQNLPQTIERVRVLPEGYIINTASEMTEITAEAWRISVLIYLQCRIVRLPRNHPDVLANLTDLAKCIRIMPTSGNFFTAQAPLFPVFLLGMIATVDEHINVAYGWFESVTSTPVRSSVPPLYEALKRIWTWIDTEPNLRLPYSFELDEIVANRHPWWEYLVHRVAREEPEVLCLT